MGHHSDHHWPDVGERKFGQKQLGGQDLAYLRSHSPADRLADAGTHTFANRRPDHTGPLAAAVTAAKPSTVTTTVTAAEPCTVAAADRPVRDGAGVEAQREWRRIDVERV